MLRFTTGDMFETPADIRVNTVNCVGVMGAGVALAFRNRLPEMFVEYKRECELGHVRPGKLHIWKNLSGDWVINFPTKRHWREKSRYEDIELGLVALKDYLAKQGNVRVTLPALGCGHGGLDWNRVAPMIEEHLQGLEAEIIVFDPADSRIIGHQEVNGLSNKVPLLKKIDKGFPHTLGPLGIQEVYYKGAESLLTNPDVAVAYSSKPAEREQTVALDCIAELARPGIQFCFVLNNSLATKIAALALEKGSQVVAWIPQGLSRYHLPRVLRPAYSAGNLLLISAAKPHQGWNPSIARQSTLASLLTSKLNLVTDPEPKWINQVGEDVLNAIGGRTFYVRYQETAPNLERCLRELSARYIGRRSVDGKPNIAPILEALQLPVSQEPIPVSPSSQNKKAEITHQSGSEVPQQLFAQTIYQPEQNKIGRYPKRLIEVDLPIKRISEHARREKSIRHGHISTLHIWWARRPLAACRAVICAALWPDPADSLCPQAFRDRTAAIITEFAEKAATQKDLMEHCSNDTRSKWMLLSQPASKLDANNEAHLNVMRNALLDFIADFANWDNSTQADYLEASRALTQAAHEALGGEPSTRPLVVDPFAGGGSIPLEALRVGADAFASDINPVAVLLNKVVLEYIPKYGQSLADEVRKWGAWIKQEAEKEMAEVYPQDADGATPIAYLWARTIQCEGPGCGAEVPLIRSFLLGKKDGRATGISIKISQEKKTIAYQLKQSTDASSFSLGTLRRGSATCPICGFTMAGAKVRKQVAEKFGGADSARLLAVYCDSSRERFYREPKESDFRALNLARSFILAQRNCRLEDGTTCIPDEELPYLRSIFNVNLIGIDRWEKMFSSRQLDSLLVLSNLVRSCFDKIKDRDLATAVTTALALIVDRQADYSSSICTWVQSGEFVGHTFAQGQSLPIKWDFAEVVPFASGSGSWEGAVGWVVRVIENLTKAQLLPGIIQKATATNHPLPDDSAQLVVTDSPYYDAVPYADLSDFFYVWLKRNLGKMHPSLFENHSTPKQGEIVQLAERNQIYAFKTREYFEELMAKALSESRRVTTPDGLAVIVFAHKETTAWETMLQAVISAGWIVVASWAIDTERQGRLRSMDSAALASSVHLVCRPRASPDGSVRADDIGDWRDVLQELPRHIHDWMPRLAQEGVVGADAIFACLGPALEIFSRYSRVEKASGEQVMLKEYLENVWAAVAKEAMGMIFAGADATGFEEDARLTAMWMWTLSTAQGKDNLDSRLTVALNKEDENHDESELQGAKKQKVGGFFLEYDAARLIAQGLGAYLEKLDHLVEIKGDTAKLLSVAERTRHLFGKDDAQAPTTKRKKKEPQMRLAFIEELEQAEAEDGWGKKDAPRPGSTTLDRVHQSMILFAAGRAEAMKRFLVEEGAGNDARFWRLAQALAALYPSGTDEKRWVEGVLARKKSLGF
jgi:putative DNA methylase